MQLFANLDTGRANQDLVALLTATRPAVDEHDHPMLDSHASVCHQLVAEVLDDPERTTALILAAAGFTHACIDALAATYDVTAESLIMELGLDRAGDLDDAGGSGEGSAP